MSREIQIVLPDPRGDQPNDYPPPEGYGFTKTWPPGAPPRRPGERIRRRDRINAQGPGWPPLILPTDQSLSHRLITVIENPLARRASICDDHPHVLVLVVPKT
jgi:hypothetical protein